MELLFVGHSPEKINYCRKHSHSCWEIVVPVFGEGVVETEKETVEFSLGSVYVLPPDTGHITRSDTEFSDIYIQADSLPFRKSGITSVKNEQDFCFLAKLLLKTYRKRDANFLSSAENTLKLMVSLISDMLKAESGIDEKGTNGNIIRLREYIAENIADPLLDTAKIARHFGYSTDHIRRIYKEETGLSPKEYLSELRLSEAKNLLRRATAYSVGEIAEQCGFSDRFYFSRFFKKKTGLTPLDYRKSEKNL